MERFRGRFIRKSVLAGRKNLRNVFLVKSYHESQDEGSSIAHDDKSIGVDGSVCEDRSSTGDKFSASNAGVCIATLTPSPSDIDEARRADDGQPTSAFSQTDLLLCENDDSAKGRRERAGNIENQKKIEDVLGGRWIVELCLIAERLNRGCVACSSPLELINCVKEQRFGLASVIHIRCSAEGCRATTMVQTSKTHTGRSGTCRAYDVNTKAALGKFIPHSQHLCQS